MREWNLIILATESSIHISRIFLTKVRDRVMYVDTSIKNEDTWCEILRHSKCRKQLSPESIQGVITQTTSRTNSPRSIGGTTVSVMWTSTATTISGIAATASVACATLFISLPRLWESFVLSAVHSILQAFFLSHPFSLTGRYISCYRLIWFPIKPSLESWGYLFSLSPVVPTDVFLLSKEN